MEKGLNEKCSYANKLIDSIYNLLNSSNKLEERKRICCIDNKESYETLENLFNEENHFETYYKTYYIDRPNQDGLYCYVAILDNELLVISIRVADSDKKIIHYEISLGPNASNCFVKIDNFGYIVSVVDDKGEELVKNNLRIGYYHKYDKIPLNKKLKPINLNELRKKINNLRNRNLLGEKVSSLNDEEVSSVLEFINNNLAKEKEQQKVLRKTL